MTKIQCTVDIKDEDVIGILDSAFAYCTWWEGIDLVKHGTNTNDAFAGHVMSGGTVEVAIVVNKDEGTFGDTGAFVDKTGEFVTYQVTRELVEKGLQALANNEKYLHHFTDIVNDNTDAITGHVLIQFVMFGDVVFD